MSKQKNIRNFSIIAHIDHGKSTLAKSILEFADNSGVKKNKKQIFDSMDLEKERGITIKLNATTFYYFFENQEYVFNLVDTPGHVDFNYEVSRSLAACEGVLLVIDATRSVESQTIVNAFLAIDNHLKIIIVVNKIDLLNADIKRVKDDIKKKIGLDSNDIICVSAKTKENIEEVLKAIVNKIPAPTNEDSKPLRALIFDSYYDSYRGVVVLIRIKDGFIKEGDLIYFMFSKKKYLVTELGIKTDHEIRRKELHSGEIGYLCAQIKDIKDVIIGETITLDNKKAEYPLPGYKKMVPMVYCGVYPINSNNYNDLKKSLDKLSLNDSSLTYEIDNSQALGYGFQCGFLGLLHMDIVKERLEREYNQKIILTVPNVMYHVFFKDNSSYININNPSKLNDLSLIKKIEEPYVNATITSPKEYVGVITELCQNRRGIYQNIEYCDDFRVVVKYLLPLNEIIFDFFDKLKSCTKGYANLDYEIAKYQESNLAKMDILVNGKIIDSFSTIVHKDNAYNRGLNIIKKLEKIIPRHQFEIALQVALNNKIIARSNIKAVRKDVLSKCYGGDITRKKKLLEKQKEGKKRMKKIGSIEIPQEAFIDVFSI